MPARPKKWDLFLENENRSDLQEAARQTRRARAGEWAKIFGKKKKAQKLAKDLRRDGRNADADRVLEWVRRFDGVIEDLEKKFPRGRQEESDSSESDSASASAQKKSEFHGAFRQFPNPLSAAMKWSDFMKIKDRTAEEIKTSTLERYARNSFRTGITRKKQKHLDHIVLLEENGKKELAQLVRAYVDKYEQAEKMIDDEFGVHKPQDSGSSSSDEQASDQSEEGGSSSSEGESGKSGGDDVVQPRAGKSQFKDFSNTHSAARRWKRICAEENMTVEQLMKNMEHIIVLRHRSKIASTGQAYAEFVQELESKGEEFKSMATRARAWLDKYRQAERRINVKYPPAAAKRGRPSAASKKVEEVGPVVAKRGRQSAASKKAEEVSEGVEPVEQSSASASAVIPLCPAAMRCLDSVGKNPAGMIAAAGQAAAELIKKSPSDLAKEVAENSGSARSLRSASTWMAVSKCCDAQAEFHEKHPLAALTRAGTASCLKKYARLCRAAGELRALADSHVNFSIENMHLVFDLVKKGYKPVPVKIEHFPWHSIANFQKKVQPEVKPPQDLPAQKQSEKQTEPAAEKEVDSKVGVASPDRKVEKEGDAKKEIVSPGKLVEEEVKKAKVFRVPDDEEKKIKLKRKRELLPDPSPEKQRDVDKISASKDKDGGGKPRPLPAPQQQIPFIPFGGSSSESDSDVPPLPLGQNSRDAKEAGSPMRAPQVDSRMKSSSPNILDEINRKHDEKMSMVAQMAKRNAAQHNRHDLLPSLDRFRSVPRPSTSAAQASGAPRCTAGGNERDRGDEFRRNRSRSRSRGCRYQVDEFGRQRRSWSRSRSRRRSRSRSRHGNRDRGRGRSRFRSRSRSRSRSYRRRRERDRRSSRGSSY